MYNHNVQIKQFYNVFNIKYFRIWHTIKKYNISLKCFVNIILNIQSQVIHSLYMCYCNYYYVSCYECLKYILLVLVGRVFIMSSSRVLWAFEEDFHVHYLHNVLVRHNL